MLEMSVTDLAGKVIVVTGAGGNLGSSMARVLAARNAKLVMSDINADALNQRFEEVRQAGGEAIAHVADVTKEADIQALMERAVSEYGGLDVLVNNAGLIGQEHKIEVLDLTPELWDRTMNINLKSVYLATRAALPHLIKRGGGSIINMSSGSSVSGYLMVSAYAASKGAVNVFTKYVATQYGKHNIRCNAVAPGIHLSEEALARTASESLKQLEEHCMLPRLGVSEDIAKVVAFLASDDSYYITAQLIQVDGGLLDHAPHMAEARRNDGFYRSALEHP
jgi:NAD(P)-dependent dehydrogenase (short-subunit alcohol dehydrogenase family)